MRKVYVLVPLMAIVTVSIGLKKVFEVDYYPLERSKIEKFDPADYFNGTGFQFERLNSTEFLGIKGNCLITVGVSNRDGDSDATFQNEFQAPDYQIRYLYRGVISSRPNYFKAQLDHYLQMLKVGIGKIPEPMLALHMSLASGCNPLDFDSLIWSEQ